MLDAYMAFCEICASPEYQKMLAKKRKSGELIGTHVFAFTSILRAARHSVPTGEAATTGSSSTNALVDAPYGTCFS
jgi:hypothetical protein